MNGITHRDFAVVFARPCAKCKGTKGRGTYEYRNGHIFKDTWVCECGEVFYHWEWESTMIAAQECRKLGGGEGEPQTSQAMPARTEAGPRPVQSTLW